MSRTKTTLALDDLLLRRLRVKAARTGQTLTEVVEQALQEGMSVIDRARTRGADEDEALGLASAAVHEVRAEGSRRRRA